MDEEYCFGVCYKECLKEICFEVDMLMLIVIFIFWILNMVMFGVWDMFIIVIFLAKWFFIKIFV